VALDASPPSLVALDAAAALAERLGAEIEGLYVEDVDCARLAALPLGRLVDAVSAAVRAPQSGEFDAAFRALAARARERLAEAAARRRLTWSFRVVRGSVATEVLAASEGADLVCVGTTSRPGEEPGRLGRTAVAVAAHARGAVAVVAREGGLSAPYVVVHDGTEAGRRALAVAATIAAPAERVAVVVPSERSAARAPAAREAEAALGRPVPVDEADCSSPGALSRAVRARGGRTLVVPLAVCAGAGDLAVSLARVVADARCAVVAVR
jgi:nucleotide-binding universal stress UspA family protein